MTTCCRPAIIATDWKPTADASNGLAYVRWDESGVKCYHIWGASTNFHRRTCGLDILFQRLVPRLRVPSRPGWGTGRSRNACMGWVQASDMTLGREKLATTGHAHLTASGIDCRGCSRFEA